MARHRKREIKICACGCGETFECRTDTKTKYKDQKHAWSVVPLDDKRRQFGKTNLGYKRSEENKQKQAETRKKLNQEGKLPIWNRGVTGYKLHDEVTKKIIGDASRHLWKTEAKKESHRKCLLRQYKNGYSSLEDKFCGVLQKEGFYNINISENSRENEEFINTELSPNYKTKAFIQQYMTCGQWVDFYFPEKKLAIFVDGIYWHCKEGKFSGDIKLPGGITGYARRERDKSVTKKLEDNGYKVLRIWEDDFLENKIKVKELV